MGTGNNCSYTNSTGNCADTSTVNNISTYLFWVILACAALFTVLVLCVSYVICRYRRPGCADASTARDRFLEENILAHTLTRNRTLISTSPVSITPSNSSPAGGHTPSNSPDLLVQRPAPAGGSSWPTLGATTARTKRSMIPVKKPNPQAVNNAFVMSAEAFAGRPIAAQLRGGGGGASPSPSAPGSIMTRGLSAQTATVTSAVAAAAARTGVGVGVARPIPSRLVQRVQECDPAASGGATSPRMVQLGGLGSGSGTGAAATTPRGGGNSVSLGSPRVVRLMRDKGRTESKQTIISSDADSMTTVGT